MPNETIPTNPSPVMPGTEAARVELEQLLRGSEADLLSLAEGIEEGKRDQGGADRTQIRPDPGEPRPVQDDIEEDRRRDEAEIP